MEENKTMSIEEVLESEGKYVGLTRGVSMLPMIKSGKDVVVIAKKTERLKPYDVALYKRDDGAYVLHRVLKVVGKGYVIRGDNCYAENGSRNQSESDQGAGCRGDSVRNVGTFCGCRENLSGKTRDDGSTV